MDIQQAVEAEMSVALRNVQVPETWDRRGLPGWSYSSAELLELEKDEVFRRHWQ